MKFNTGKEMYEYLKNGHDLYNAEIEIYVFPYNEDGSLYAYKLTIEQAAKLCKKARENHKKWSNFLGADGEMYDPYDAIILCEGTYQKGNWIDTEDTNFEPSNFLYPEQADCYLVCQLDDERYSDVEYYLFRSLEKAKAFCKDHSRYLMYDDVEMEEELVKNRYGEEHLRINVQCDREFEIHEIIPLSFKDIDALCIWHHAYDGIDFQIRRSGTYQQCMEFAKAKSFDEYLDVFGKDKTYYEEKKRHYDYKHQFIIDTGTEWEVWDVIQFDKKCPFYDEKGRVNIVVRALSESDRASVLKMDCLSGSHLDEFLGDNTDYAWGIFVDGEMAGYCSLGLADDVEPLIEDHPGYKLGGSMILSDVYISPFYREQGYGTMLIRGAMANRWELDGKKNSVYLQAMDPKVMNFYKKSGFKQIQEDREIMVLCTN